MKDTAKKLIVKIICFVVMAVVLAALIVGDVFAWAFAPSVDRLLGITEDDFSNASAEFKAGDQLCREIEEASAVLLKNKNETLPLGSDVTNLNVFGYGATDEGFLLKGVGSGSSTISAQKKVTLMEALRGETRVFDRYYLEDPDKYGHEDEKGNYIVDDEAGLEADLETWADDNLTSYNVNEEIAKIYENWISKNSGSIRPQSGLNSGNVYKLAEPEVALFNDVIDQAKTFSDVALFVISRDGGENVGEIPSNYLDITAAERSTITYLKQHFAKVIVILNTTNTMHMGFRDELDVDACLYVGLTGQSGARAIPDILSGKVNPSGKFTDIVTRSAAVAQKYDPTFVNREAVSNSISYIDDIYYGYKWFETADVEEFFKGYENSFGTGYNAVVQYPFGHGLSYTEFDQEIVSVTYGENNVRLKDGDKLDQLDAGTEITVKVKVTNVGSVAGKDVVQLYYTPQYKGGIEKAHVNLLDFGKTTTLKPNASEEVTLKFTPYDMASYDAYDKNKNSFWGYELESGSYEIKLMANSHEVIDSVDLVLESGKLIDKDPVTGVKVSNRFTGADSAWDASKYNGYAYANLGSDGYEAGISRDVWLSRSNFKETYPAKRHSGASGSLVNAANRYYNDAYAELLPKDYKKEIDAELYLAVLVTKDAEGKIISTEKPTKAHLEGAKPDEGTTLEYNWDLIEALTENYDSELWETFLNQMSADEMRDLVHMGGFRRVAVESVGKPRQYDYDGPAGFNTNSLSGSWSSESDRNSWTAYESEALIGCSWDKGLMLALGLQQGAEAIATHVNGWYAPGVNLHRSNYSARNYEYYSEDAVLSGKLAAKVILGAKINGLNCYIKHFACSEEGPNPREVNTWISEQNLRENYLRPFEIAVKEGGANSVMTAFNNIGSVWAGANYAMNVEVLRNEWGFRGSLITDYSTGGSEGGMYTRQGVRAGNDMWLNPNPGSISNGLDMSKDEVFARNAAHNILYTAVDTLNTYNTYKNNPGLIGEYKDILTQYGATLGISFNEEGFSWWKVVLIIIDVLVFLGFVVWALFLLFPVKEILRKRFGKNREEVSGESEPLPENE